MPAHKYTIGPCRLSGADTMEKFPPRIHEDPTANTSVGPAIPEYLAKLQPNSKPARGEPSAVVPHLLSRLRMATENRTWGYTRI